MSDGDRKDILLIEDAAPQARVYLEYLGQEPYRVSHVETGRAALEELGGAPPEAIILDLRLPDMDGLDILRHVRRHDIPSTVVVITSHGSINTAVEAMKAGADDFIVKPFTSDRLIYTLRNALERRRLSRAVETYNENFDRREYCGFIGSSLPMQAVYRFVDSAAPSKATVFITGESGVGKEVCAEALHSRGPRTDKPFIALNCAAIPRELMESEVFGHVKGAFTGAVADRQGAASLADGGTLFLDEVCEMDPGLQAKLLRFVQTGGFQKVGSGAAEKVDVRFVCASNRDPWAEVEAGRFREDLYFRLHVIPIHLPPLRERDGDIEAIARHFLAEFATEEGKGFTGFSPQAERAIAEYSWPGNVRQLQNVIRHVVVLNDGEVVSGEMLAAALGGAKASRESEPEPTTVKLRAMSEVEMDYIREALKVTDGNVSKAAALLEMSPSTVYRRLREAGEED